MRKTVALLALLLAYGTPWARAQVAVPEIGPVAVRLYDSREAITPSNNIVPDNPAALQWGAPSRIAGGTLNGHKSDQVDGKSTSYKGTFGGLRWVEQRTSIAVAGLDYKVDFPAGAPTPHLERHLSSGAIAFSVPTTLAWGFGVTHLNATTIPGSPVQETDARGWTLGASWRLSEGFFLGAGYGKEKATLSNPPLAQTGQFDRSHNMVGIGLRGGGTLVWHLEVDRLHRDDYKDNTGFVVLPGYDQSLYTAEGILGSWLFGYAGYTIDGQGPNQSRVQGYSADFGYAPLNGLTLTWRYENSKHSIAGLQVSSESLNSVALAWQF
ncbi:MAG TPA: hypothetical protein VKB51_03960 [bacterium]|nr:hypothetical protein [bacterium]